MKLIVPIKNFVKEFYVVKYEPRRNVIVISDTNEGILGGTPNSIWLGTCCSPT